MNRKSDLFLSNWRTEINRKPLVVRGARQVGKTYLVESWGQNHFKNVVTVDLEKEIDLRQLFKNRDPKQIVAEIALIKATQIVPGETLLFIDEIQACTEALAVLRYFFEEIPDLHVIAAGSLLEFALKDFSHSMPVGRIEYLHMHPLSYCEFVSEVAGQELANIIRTSAEKTEISKVVHERLLGLLREYFFIGGMPEAVATWQKTKDLLRVERIHASIIQTIQDDFSKYKPQVPAELLRATIKYTAANIGNKVKYSGISRDHRAVEVRKAINVLAWAKLISTVVHSSANGVPLGAEANADHFKLIFLDIALLGHILGLKLTPLDQLMTVNEGSLAEQFVGQELLCSRPSYREPELYYWHREAKNSNAELDYLVENNGKIIPIEVKSGKGSSLRSMHKFLEEKKSDFGIRFNTELPINQPLIIGTRTAQLLSRPLYLAGATF